MDTRVALSGDGSQHAASSSFFLLRLFRAARPGDPAGSAAPASRPARTAGRPGRGRVRRRATGRHAGRRHDAADARADRAPPPGSDRGRQRVRRHAQVAALDDHAAAGPTGRSRRSWSSRATACRPASRSSRSTRGVSRRPCRASRRSARRRRRPSRRPAPQRAGARSSSRPAPSASRSSSRRRPRSRRPRRTCSRAGRRSSSTGAAPLLHRQRADLRASSATCRCGSGTRSRRRPC